MEQLGIPEGGLSPNSSFFVLLVPFFFFLISDFSRGYVVVQAYECLGIDSLDSQFEIIFYYGVLGSCCIFKGT